MNLHPTHVWKTIKEQKKKNKYKTKTVELCAAECRRSHLSPIEWKKKKLWLTYSSSTKLFLDYIFIEIFAARHNSPTNTLAIAGSRAEHIVELFRIWHSLTFYCCNPRPSQKKWRKKEVEDITFTHTGDRIHHTRLSPYSPLSKCDYGICRTPSMLTDSFKKWPESAHRHTIFIFVVMVDRIWVMFIGGIFRVWYRRTIGQFVIRGIVVMYC